MFKRHSNVQKTQDCLMSDSYDLQPVDMGSCNADLRENNGVNIIRN